MTTTGQKTAEYNRKSPIALRRAGQAK